MITVTIICALGTVAVALPVEAAARITPPVVAAFCARGHEIGAPFPGGDLWRRMQEEVERELRG